MPAVKNSIAAVANQQLVRGSEFTADECPCVISRADIPLKAFRRDARHIYNVVQIIDLPSIRRILIFHL
eukprot:1359660-Amphidinium_carterae.1